MGISAVFSSEETCVASGLEKEAFVLKQPCYKPLRHLA